jgi:hypothetical protein
MVRIRRGGRMMVVPAAAIVPGDLVRLGPGDLLAVLGAVAVQLAILRRVRRGGAREVDHPPAVPKVPPDTGLVALPHGPRFEQAGLLGG